LAEARSALDRGRGALIVVGGEPGIGKTRLVAHFLRGSRTARTVASADCREEAQRPFGPFLDLLDTIAADDPIAVAPDVALALAQIRRAADGTTSDETVVERGPLFAKLAAYFVALAARRSTILVIDDLQWADDSTLDFVTYLAAKTEDAALLLLATYRADLTADHPRLGTTLARMVWMPSHVHVVLDRLAPDEIAALVAGALAGRTIAEETLRTIVARCDGNPFFAEELVKSAIARPEASETELPHSIRATIGERLASFSADERRLLATASVLGIRFDPELLALVVDRDTASVMATVRRATALQILVAEPGDRHACRFRHALTLDVIRDELHAADEARMHGAIVRAIENAPDPDRHLTDLAFHAWRAGDRERSLRYNERAGDAAAANRAMPEAVLHLERAYESAHDAADRARLLTAIGSAYQRQGRLTESVARFEEALALRMERGERDLAAPLVAWIAGDRNNLGDSSGVARARAFLAEHGPQLQAIPRDSLAAFLARAISIDHRFDVVDALLAGIDATELPPRARQNVTIAQINRCAYFGDTLAFRKTAREFATYAANVPETLRISAYYTIAQAGTYLGAHDVVERVLALTDRLAAEARTPDLATYGTAVRACYHWERGEIATARACIDRVLAAGVPFVALAIVASITPLLALALDDDALVPASFTGDVLDALESGDGDVALLCGARGTWLARRGRHAEARRDFARAVNAAERATPVLAASTLGCVEFGDASTRDRARARAAEAAAAHESEIVHAVDALGAALVARARDDAAEAERLGREAAVLYGRLGFPLREAQALEAAGAIDDALAVYRRCGAVGDVRRLEPRSARRPIDPSRILTKREREVADLVAAGLANTEIAERLFLSVKTVEKHVASLFEKLDVRSRTQIATHLLRERRTVAR
jgi:DNA-binding NarL/FixJ family response regulator